MIYGIIGIWVLCGLLAYGQFMGSQKEHFEPVLGIRRGDIFGGIAFSLFGPVSIMTEVVTNAECHGKAWHTPSWQIRTSPPTDPRFRKE